MNRESLTKIKPFSYSKSYMTADLFGIFRVTTEGLPMNCLRKATLLLDRVDSI